MQMQDDIHKLKKMMDLVFEKMCASSARLSSPAAFKRLTLVPFCSVPFALVDLGGTRSDRHGVDSPYDAADAYGASPSLSLSLYGRGLSVLGADVALLLYSVADKDRIIEMLNRLSSRVRSPSRRHAPATSKYTGPQD